MRGRDRIDDPIAGESKHTAEQTILVVDDEPTVRAVLMALCKQIGYQTVEATNGAEAIELARAGLPDLILMDAKMPEVDGFAATERLKTDAATGHIPVLILTGLTTRQDRLKGIAAGASDFLSKPVDLEELTLRLKNNLQIKQFHDFLTRHAEILEAKVAERTRRLSEAVHNLELAQTTIEKVHRDTILRLATLAEFRDEDTGTHIQRIGHFARELSSRLGLQSFFQDCIYHGAMMHDIGKVAVPDSVLLKQGSLTDEEWVLMRLHTSSGAKILEGSASPYLQMGAVIAQHHHERWDGSGYPSGVKGDAIPLPARITAIADTYDALRSARPYKQAFSHEESCRIIVQGDGRTSPEHFDPEILDAFIHIQSRFDEVFEDLQDE